jgi:uncharacterized damage-inducible protein DinB
MSAKAQAKKDKILADLIEARQNLLEAARSLSPAQQDEVFLGAWSVKDLLAHLVGWDYANLECAEAVPARRLPAFYAHYDRDWQIFNAMLVAEHKRDDFADLIALLAASHRKLMDVLRAVPAEDFVRDFGVRFRGYKVTIARTIEYEAKDERVHRQQILDFQSGGASRD